MKTLAEHNAEIAARDEMLRNMNLAGVACDMCGAMMVYTNKTSPVGAGQHVHCQKCTYRGVLKS